MAAAAVGTGIGVVRVGGPGATNSMFAEDGTVFYGQAVQDGSLHAAKTPYSGYLHAVPRLIAAVVSALPVRLAAAAMAVAAAAIVAALAVLVFLAGERLIASPWLRAVLAAAFAVLPTAQEEVLDSVANLQWFFIAAAGVALLWWPARRSRRIAGVIVITLAGLSQPLTALLAPLVVRRVVRRRRLDGFVLSWAIALVGHALAIALTSAHRSAGASALSPPKIVGYFVLDVLGRGLFGIRGLAH